MSLHKEGMTRRRLLKLSGMAGAGMFIPTFGKEVEGSIYITSGDARYDKLRQLFNSNLSKKPKWIAECRSESDVQHAVRKAVSLNLPVAMKSGGHCFMGSSVNDGGMSINLRSLNHTKYDPKSKTLVTGPGVKLGELYDLLLPHGRLLPAGSCNGVGIGGLTLGGGYGLFARQYGLTCDHLTRVKMVNGNGSVIDSNEDKDLLWACRGGGNGNFGVVTSMEFKTQAAPERLGAQRFTARNLSEQSMVSLVEKWFTIAEQLPDPIFSALVLNGSQITVLLTSSYSTSGPAFQKAVRFLKSAGFSSKGASNTPIARALKRYYGRPGPLPFHNVSGGYYDGYQSLSHGIKEIVHRVQKNPGLIFQVNTLGGAISQGAESAYAHRQFPFLGEIQAYWQKSEKRDVLIAQVNEIQGIIGAKHHYRNYPDENLKTWADSYYGDKLEKLQQLKLRYDPKNLFRNAQSISPAI